MDRVNRLVAIVLLLQSRKLVRAEEIAAHFDVSVRTVYRDLRALDEAGVPIAAEAGRGYSLVEGYHLPPVMFTQEEAAALFVGAEFVERLTDASLGVHARSALMKIRAVLSPERKEFIERLEASTAIHGSTLFIPEQHRQMTTIQDAVVHRRVLRMLYYAHYRDALTTRDVEPLGMIFYSGAWQMVAHCRLRDDIRHFRIDRVRTMDLLEEQFPERNDFSMREYLRTLHAPENNIEVRVRFSKEAARRATERYSFGLVEEVETAEGVEMTFLTPSIYSMAGWLTAYGRGVKILAPDKLRTIVVDTARAILRHHDAEKAVVV